MERETPIFLHLFVSKISVSMGFPTQGVAQTDRILLPNPEISFDCTNPIPCALPCAEGGGVSVTRWSFPPVKLSRCARPLRLRPEGGYALAVAHGHRVRFAALVPVTGRVLAQSPPGTSRPDHQAHDAGS